ncbi:MAG: tetratricopeptide repeat protein [Flavobacteriales bacterium]|nr:tetratricopeptide repeat protein [Flavobacteriales bacterium]
MMRLGLACCFLLLTQLTFSQTENGKDAYSIGVKGIKLIDEGQFEEGIKLLKQARNLEPHDYDYAFEIGKAYLKSGNPKKAEKYLFELQYNKNSQADLYIALANCYLELEEVKKTPDSERKKELDALRYGILKLPSEGILYLELGKRKLTMEESVDALAVFETGIQKAPNFAENYFWAAKLMKATGNQLWAWFYAELCYNMTDDLDLLRSSAMLISASSNAVFELEWNGNPEKLDQSLNIVFSEKCSNSANESDLQLEKRKCLLENWNYTGFSISPLFQRLVELKNLGFLEAYLATILQENDKDAFLKWLPPHVKTFEEYRTWRYWNPMRTAKAVSRLNIY